MVYCDGAEGMRLPDWQLRLAAFYKERASMPFEWGRNDCCMFAADAVAAMTGWDFAAEVEGYTTALQAERVLKARGGLRAVASDALGDPIPPLMATVGDVVLMENEGRELLAICNGTNAIGPGAEGVAVLDMAAALAAWRV